MLHNLCIDNEDLWEEELDYLDDHIYGNCKDNEIHLRHLGKLNRRRTLCINKSIKIKIK